MSNYKSKYTGTQVDGLLDRIPGVESTAQEAHEIAQGAADALPEKANDVSVVHLAGAETIAGNKTFSGSVAVPAPTNDSDAANKNYVDSTINSAVEPISDRITVCESEINNVYTKQEAVQKFAYLDAALGNQIQFTEMIEAMLAEMEIRGETTVRRAVFTDNSISIINGEPFEFVAGETIIVEGCEQTANNKVVAVSSLSSDKRTMYFPTSTFIPYVETQGVLSKVYNRLSDGNFSIDTNGNGFSDGWETFYIDSYSMTNNEQYIDANSDDTDHGITADPIAGGLITGHRYYGSIFMKSSNGGCRFRMHYRRADGSYSYSEYTNVGVSDYVRATFVIDIIDQYSTPAYLYRVYILNDELSTHYIGNGENATIKEAMFIDMGDSNSPMYNKTKEEMDNLLIDWVDNVDKEYYIGVDPDHPQTLDSQTSFDYLLDNGNIMNAESKSVSGIYSNCTYDANTCIATINGEIPLNQEPRYEILKLLDIAQFKPLLKVDAKYRCTVKLLGGTFEGDVGVYVPIYKSGAWYDSLNPSYFNETVSINTIRYKELIIPDDITATYVSIVIGRNNISSSRAYANNVKIQFKMEPVINGNVGDEDYFPPSQFIKKNILNQDTLGNQLENREIPSSYNTDGSVATWAAQDVIKKEGSWGLYSEMMKINLQTHSILMPLEATGESDLNCVFFFAGVYGDARHNSSGVMSNLFVTNGVSELYLRNNEAVSGHNSQVWIAKVAIKKSRLAGYNYSLTIAEKIALFRTWCLENNMELYSLGISTYTELCDADQTALNSVDKTFAGITNISLSDLGQVYAKGAKDITKVIDNLTAAVAALG